MENQDLNQKRQPPSPFLKYSGLGIQMLATIAAFGVIGYFVGKTSPPNATLFILAGLLLGTVLSVVIVIRQLGQDT